MSHLTAAAIEYINCFEFGETPQLKMIDAHPIVDPSRVDAEVQDHKEYGDPDHG